ncbi:hypothetical protein BH09ACT9_BH09ACT9_50070 [soil metagenome]
MENVHAFIVGEHGDSEIPLWSSATIGGVPATSFVGPSGGVLGPDLRAKVAKSVVESAYEIIEGKGATNLAIGLSSAFIAEVVLRDEQRVLPVSTLQSGVHGLEHVCLSLPRWLVVLVPAESSKYRYRKERLRGSDLLPGHCERCRNLWDCEYLFSAISDI